MILDKQIKRLLVKRGITFARLGRETGISPKTIYQWTNGQKPRNIEQVKKVANYFEVSMDQLVFGEVRHQPGMHEILPDINAGVYEVILRRVKQT